MLRWLRRSWFRHLLSLRPDFGAAVMHGWRTGEIGLPRFYWHFDAGLHARRWRFIGFIWKVTRFQVWLGIRDSN